MAQLLKHLISMTKFQIVALLLVANFLTLVCPFSVMATNRDQSCAEGLTTEGQVDPLNINDLSATEAIEIRAALSKVVADEPATGGIQEPTKIKQWPRIKKVFGKFATIKNGLKSVLSTYFNFKQIRKNVPKSQYRLLVKVLADPDYTLTAKEQAIIDSDRDLGNTIESAREFAKTHNRIAKTYSTLARSNRYLFWSILVGAITFRGAISSGAFAPVDIAEKPLESNQIELIYTSPLPHSIIRIGDTIYNFGPGFISKRSYEEDMNLNNNLLVRNSTRIRLNLNSEELEQFKSFLEGEVGKFYTWLPNFISPTAFVCVAATHRALEKTTSIDVPAGIDRSPILSESYFAARYLMGDPHVAGIYFSNRGVSADKYVDLGIGVIDAFIGADYLWINAAAAQADYLPNSIRIGH